LKARIRWVKDEELWECTKCHAEVEEGEEECWNCGAVFTQSSKSSGAPKLVVKLLIGVLAAAVTFGVLYFTHSNLLFHDQQTAQPVQQTVQPTEPQQQQPTESTEQQTQQSTESTEQQTQQPTESTEQQTVQSTEQQTQQTTESTEQQQEQPQQ